MRERDRNRKMFHKGHYEVIAARFREQASRYADTNEGIFTLDSDLGEITDVSAAASLRALRELADALADRFEFDNDDFDRNIFLERCGFIV